MEQKKRTIHMIGNAHIDPVWLWRWQDGFSEVKATFQSALDRMEEYEDFIFTCGSSIFYQWVEKNEPAMFEKIRQRVAEGRWVIVGGWLLQADGNQPSGESFARQALYGQRYFLSRFGVCARVGYSVDSFGHNGMLPQLLQKSGMDAYVFMRPQVSDLALPASAFWWQSPDGSRVRACRLPIGYNTNVSGSNPLQERHARVLQMAEHESSDLMQFYGVHELQKNPDVNVIFSSPNAFFDALKGKDLPVVNKELQHFSSGCYSAHSKTKKDNRRAEQALLRAEAMSALCAGLLPEESNKGPSLQGAWEKVLFNQFHDILCGTSIEDAYQDAADFFGYACTLAAQEENSAAQSIAWQIDTMQEPPFALSKEQDGILW
ncbi:MAG: alpha-mannosidase, partial [Ruthenibacterium sp.]